MTEAEIEDVGSFRMRARSWLADSMPRITRQRPVGWSRSSSDEEELASVARARELQATLHAGGFAGICFPTRYGGQGLTPAHQKAFNDECAGYEMPTTFNVPTLGICAATILGFGTEQQKVDHIGAILRGEELWMQFLSEPSGGSDVAGALTSAVRDGEEWILNGSKIWTTGAWWSDWGLCLARTNWDVPKHRGLTVFMFPIHQPAIEVHRIEMINGSREFCQEFLTDLRVPDTDRVGDVDAGWTVGIGWMQNERTEVGGGSPFVSGPSGEGGSSEAGLVSLAAEAGRLDDPIALDLIGEAEALELTREAFMGHLATSISTGRLPAPASALLRLFSGTTRVREATAALEIAGDAAVAWPTDVGDPTGGPGVQYLVRQVAEIGGGTTEMARNVISERVLGLPREPAADRDRPFREVPRGPSAEPGASGSAAGGH